MSRVIMHVDMDSFFCSVERALNPALEDGPLMVGGPAGGRGVIVACSYDVKAKGVTQGMPTSQALRLAPGVTVLPSRHRIYTQISAGILKVLSEFTSAIEPASIDESYIDATGVAGGFAGAANLANRIREKIRSTYHLPASIGVGPSRVIAKIASGYAKPDGMQVIPPEEVRAFLDPLPVSKMGGIGEKTAASLERLGIRTLGDLAGSDPKVLAALFGKNGDSLHRRARGEDSSAIVPWHETPDPKSMSNETTLAEDTIDRETLEPVLLWLSEKLASRMRTEGLAGRCFFVKLRFADFRTIDRSHTLPHYTNDERTIYELAVESVFRHAGGKKLRLVGVGMSQLSRGAAEEVELDLDRGRARRQASVSVVDEVRRRFGRSKLKKARLL